MWHYIILICLEILRIYQQLSTLNPNVFRMLIWQVFPNHKTMIWLLLPVYLTVPFKQNEHYMRDQLDKSISVNILHIWVVVAAFSTTDKYWVLMILYRQACTGSSLKTPLEFTGHTDILINNFVISSKQIPKCGLIFFIRCCGEALVSNWTLRIHLFTAVRSLLHLHLDDPGWRCIQSVIAE